MISARRLRGADVVVSAAGAGGRASVWDIDRDATIRVAEATGAARVSCFILISTMAAGHAEADPQLRDYLIAKGEADAVVMASDAYTWTVVRPGWLSDEQPTGRVALQPSDFLSDTPISRRDVATFIVELVDQPDSAGNTVIELVSGDLPIAEAVASIGRQTVQVGETTSHEGDIMKAAVLNKTKGKFEIEEVEIDKPRGREVLVETKATGLCHSDLHMSENDYGIPLPAVFGHELAGIVKEVGPDVREFAPGDHVVASLIQYCGHCKACLGGRTYQCLHPEETVRPSDGEQRLTRGGKPLTSVFGTAAFAEYSLVHENQLAKVPKELPFPQAAILGCGCVTGAGAALNTAGVKPGDTVVVIGAGGVGLNVISGAKLAGAERIIAIDTNPEKERLARRFGMTDFINARDGDPIEKVREVVPGGVDHAFEVIGLKRTSEQAVKMIRKGGAVYLIGMYPPNSSIEIDAMNDLILNQGKVMGVFMGSSNIKRDIPMYARLYLQGRFNLDDLISREINISEINGAYEELKSGATARCVITSF